MPRRTDDRRALPVLRERRVAVGLSLAELAERVGCGVPTLSGIETGKSRASRERQTALSAALGVAVEDAFAPIEQPTPRAWVSTREAASIASVSYETITRALDVGDLIEEAVDRRGGAPRRILRSELEAWMERRDAHRGLLSVNDVSARRNVSASTLRAAAAAGVVRSSMFVDGRGRQHFRFDEEQFDADYAALPACAHDGCEERALHPVGACAQHAAIIATPRGHPRRTRQRIAAALRGKPKSPEHRRALSIAVTGRPNPNRGKALPPKWREAVSVGVSKHHREHPMSDEARAKLAKAQRSRHAERPETFPQHGADREAYSRWGAKRYAKEGAKGRTRQKWLGRLGASKAPAEGARPRGRPTVAVSPEQSEEIRRLSAQGWGRRAIATRLLLGERLVRNVLSNS